ncbi:hypothetical protein [uncultured Draconibacterium sp.]|uniref:hypothetical protein n=1 Tax=uncultured Draconibacterium sp. TaxID=1573823 RepID=UPI003216683A
MKHKVLKLSTVVLLLLFIGASCEKDELDYADESIELSSSPEISVYKTNGDYFSYICIKLTTDGEPNAIPDLPVGSANKSPNRYRLKSGYIVNVGGSLSDVYTNITYEEYINYNTKNEVSSWPRDLLKSRIIDKDPYVELYTLVGINEPIRIFTLGEINSMIETGTIDEHFARIK